MSGPQITVRSMAEMLQLPAPGLVSALRRQKYPDPWRRPYYQSAAAAVRHYFEEGNDPSVLTKARNKALSIGNVTRRAHVIRVLDQFHASPHAKRALKICTNHRHVATISGVELRLSSDMQAFEAGELRVFYFGYKTPGTDAELALLHTEIAHYLLEQGGQSMPVDQIEFLDLSNGKRHRLLKRRASTIRALTKQLQQIAALWPSILGKAIP